MVHILYFKSGRLFVSVALTPKQSQYVLEWAKEGTRRHGSSETMIVEMEGPATALHVPTPTVRAHWRWAVGT